MEKLIIGVCDDIEQVTMELREQVERHLREQGIDFECKIFYSGKSLLEEIEKIGIVFLDIEMPDLDGIETGKRIKQRNPDCKIIMATGRIDRVSEAFHFQAFRFLQKPFKESEIGEALRAALEKKPGEQYIELFFERNMYKIQQKYICYIQAFNGYSEFWVGDKQFRKDISLNELEKELDYRIFARIHRQFIVNMGWIEHRQDNAVTLKGRKIPISRRKRKEFESQYIIYDVHYR